MIYCILQQNVEVVPREKNVEKRFQKCGLYTVMLKSSHGLSFL